MGPLWGYEGKRVVVSGGGGAGMGAAAVRDLVELGAEVHVFDLKEPAVGSEELPVGRPQRPAAITAAVARARRARSTRCSTAQGCPGLLSPGPT